MSLRTLSQFDDTTTDGRVTIIMPTRTKRGSAKMVSRVAARPKAARNGVPSGQSRAQRVHRTVQMSWHPDDWPENSPWMRMFENARAWVGKTSIS